MLELTLRVRKKHLDPIELTKTRASLLTQSVKEYVPTQSVGTRKHLNTYCLNSYLENEYVKIHTRKNLRTR